MTPSFFHHPKHRLQSRSTKVSVLGAQNPAENLKIGSALSVELGKPSIKSVHKGGGNVATCTSYDTKRGRWATRLSPHEAQHQGFDGIGKSTFASKADDVIFLQAEDG